MESKIETAVKHANQVYRDGACHTPKPRVIYPPHSSTKVYFPRGTILHRCGDDTGCCHHSAWSCQAVESEVVELYFLIFSANLDKHRRGRRQTPEKLSFVNHTRCACKSINEELNEV
ncbi:PDGF-and VEGF-related factor 3-like protein [Leptotrombidium deliense]|uniref:PDGF-and VEGF-related factor 3-like protein n=1 Tax=Leptotrombidium deliense TaxID=299467 RepID=A0A443SRB6_9ACAR|nr:PDGF-and VEGF-related factor 3-like protein [Leptotrombidium deliense]